MHHLFKGSVAEQVFTDRPSCRFDSEFDVDCIADLEKKLELQHPQLAALILEPVVQGAGGMWFYHPKFLKYAREICDRYDVLLIVDEIATGFGRTGKLFACEWADIHPDILCLGKALTGGYMTLAATLTTTRVAAGISQNGGVLMHGPTFMANPLACAVANASLELLLNSNWQSDIRRIETVMQQMLAPAQLSAKVADVRVLGGIGVLEMHRPVDPIAAQQHFVKQGVWVRPFGKLVYIMPPYVISNSDLSSVCDAMVAFTA